MIVSIIGRGKVGGSFGKFFTQKGHNVFYGKDNILQSDIVFITTPDSKIQDVWQEIKTLNLKNKIVAHASGAMAASVFESFEGALSAHPFTVFASAETEMENVPFILEGPGAERAKEFFASLGSKTFFIKAEDKAKYHAACVMMCNLVVGLVQTAGEVFESLGITQDYYKKPFLENAKNIYNKNLEDALTGPVARGDAGTIEKHLSALTGPQKEIYKMLSKQLLKLSKAQNTQEMEDILK